MATLYISEYTSSGFASGQVIPTGLEPAITNQTLAIGAGSVASAPFNAATRFVRLHTDAICSVKFGASPVAAATNARLAANQTEFFSVANGLAVAVISNV